MNKPECKIDANGNKSWYLNGIYYSEADWKLEVAKLNKQPVSCDGKEVEIDGKKYKLTALQRNYLLLILKTISHRSH